MRQRKPRVGTPAPAPTEATPPAPVTLVQPTHKLVATTDGLRSVCVWCGAESEVGLEDGRAVRRYRKPGGKWQAEIVCVGAPAPPAPPVQQEGDAIDAIAEKHPIIQVLRKHLPEFDAMMAPEVLDGYDVAKVAEQVDLSVECSPVIFRRGGIRPVQACMLDGGKYRVYIHEDDSRSAFGGYGVYGSAYTPEVTTAELRVMRARYLLLRGSAYRQLHLMPPHLRERVEKLYFPGGVFVPKPGSRLANVVQTGEPLSIKLEPGQDHWQVMASLMAEAGAGEDCRVVAVGQDGKHYATPLVPSHVAVPVPPVPDAEPIPCSQCGRPTPGGICDGCIDLASDLGVDLRTMSRRHDYVL